MILPVIILIVQGGAMTISTGNRHLNLLIGFQAALAVVFTLTDLAGLFAGHKIWLGAVPKALLSLSATVVVWTQSDHTFSPRDARHLRIIFTCTLITDLFVLAWTHFFPDAFILLTIGGAIALPMLSTLIWRHTEGFRGVTLKNWIVLTAIYVPVIAIIVFLKEMLVQYNLLVTSIVYAILLVPVAWSGWLPRKSPGFPSHARWMIPLATTCYFVMDVIGIFYNVRFGPNPDIFYFFTWPLYAVFLILIPLSGRKTLS
jgi:hypothetical protein